MEPLKGCGCAAQPWTNAPRYPNRGAQDAPATTPCRPSCIQTPVLGLVPLNPHEIVESEGQDDHHQEHPAEVAPIARRRHLSLFLALC
jgi:hypothetical protein